MKVESPTLHEQAVKLAKPQLEALRKAANGFETVFIKSLMSEMEKGTNMFGSGAGADIYQDMANQSMSESIGKRGSLGIGKMLYNQISPRLIAQAEAQIKLHGVPGAMPTPEPGTGSASQKTSMTRLKGPGPKA